MLAHFYTFSTWEAKVEAGGSMSSGQTGYVVRTLSQAVPPPNKNLQTTKTDKPSIMYMFDIFFIHLSVDRHLRCLQTLVSVNSATANLGVQVPLRFMLT